MQNESPIPNLESPISHQQSAIRYSVIYQATKLGDVPHLLQDFEMARRLDAEGVPLGRIYGNSSGALGIDETGEA